MTYRTGLLVWLIIARVKKGAMMAMMLVHHRGSGGAAAQSAPGRCTDRYIALPISHSKTNDEWLGD